MPLTLDQRAAENVRAMRRELDDTLHLLDRALGRAVQATVGERVVIKPAHVQRPEQKGLTCEITDVIKAGRTEMLVLTDATGRQHKYFRASEVEPAGRSEAARSEAGGQLMHLANAVVSQSHGTISLGDAVKLAARQRPELALAYQEESMGSSAEVTPDAPDSTTSEAAGSKLMQLANAIVREQGVSLRVALLKAQRVDPQSAERYFALMTGR